MLGLIVLCPESGAGLSPQALLDPLLGVPLLARAIAGAFPLDATVHGVVVVPAELVDRVKTDIVDRCVLDEIESVVAGGPDRAGALIAGLAALPDNVTHVLVQEGSRIFVPAGLADRIVAPLLQSAGAKDAETKDADDDADDTSPEKTDPPSRSETSAPKPGAAAPVWTLREPLVEESDSTLIAMSSVSSLRTLQGPQAFSVQALKDAVETAAGDFNDASEAELVLHSGGVVVPVAGDPDNFLLRDSADVSRALEVFARRAADYAFLYPKDLLPGDPIARFLNDNPDETKASEG